MPNKDIVKRRETCRLAEIRYRINHPEKVKESQRKYREAHPDRAKEQSSRWRLAHPKEFKVLYEKWEKNHRERRREFWRENWMKRRAFKLGTRVGRLPRGYWKAIVTLYGGHCAYCGLSKPLCRDHVIPLVRGGRHEVENIVPACVSCNSSKKDRLWLPVIV